MKRIYDRIEPKFVRNNRLKRWKRLGSCDYFRLEPSLVTIKNDGVPERLNVKRH